MFIYNNNKYSKEKYSLGNPTDKQGHLYYGTVIAGIEVRKQIGKKWIYRVRPGNGKYGTEVGKTYQDRYTYFVPSTILHPNGDASRTTFAAAVQAWKNLTQEEQEVWKRLEASHKMVPGRYIFIGAYMKKNYP